MQRMIDLIAIRNKSILMAAQNYLDRNPDEERLQEAIFARDFDYLEYWYESLNGDEHGVERRQSVTV